MRPRSSTTPWLALILVALVVLAICVGRPDTTRVHLTEVSHPACAVSGTQAGLDHGTLIASGTVTDITDTRVTLAADHYYFGDPAWATFPVVIDRRPDSGMTWVQGQRYFVFGEQGRLLECGETAVWSEDAHKIIAAKYR